MTADINNFQASLGGFYNYFVGYNNAGDVTRSSDCWRSFGFIAAKVSEN